jgi:hypothetical protein
LHLIENTSRAFLDAVRKSMRQIRSAVGAMTIDPQLLTAAERLQYEGYLRREETSSRGRNAPAKRQVDSSAARKTHGASTGLALGLISGFGTFGACRLN